MRTSFFNPIIAPLAFSLAALGCNNQTEKPTANTTTPAAQIQLHSKDTPQLDANGGLSKKEQAVLEEFPELVINAYDTPNAIKVKVSLMTGLSELRDQGIITRENVYRYTPELQAALDSITTTSELNAFLHGTSKKEPNLKSTELQWIWDHKKALQGSTNETIRYVSSDRFTGKGIKDVQAYQFARPAIEEYNYALKWSERLASKSNKKDLIRAFETENLEVPLRGYVVRSKQKYRQEPEIKLLCQIADRTPRGEFSEDLVKAYIACIKNDAGKLGLD